MAKETKLESHPNVGFRETPIFSLATLKITVSSQSQSGGLGRERERVGGGRPSKKGLCKRVVCVYRCLLPLFPTFCYWNLFNAPNVELSMWTLLIGLGYHIFLPHP